MQLEQIQQKCADEKLERDRLNKSYLELVEKQWSYYKTVRDFLKRYTCTCVGMHGGGWRGRGRGSGVVKFSYM